MTVPRVSVASVIGTILLAVVSATLMVITFLDYSRARTQATRQLSDQLETSVAQLASGLAIPIWNVEPRQIIQNIESVMHDPNVANVSLTTPERDYHFSRDSDGSPLRTDLPAPLQSDAISLRLPIRFADRTIANLQVSASAYLLQQQLRSSLRNKIIQFVLFDLVLVSVLYVSLRVLVIAPLKFVETYAASISSAATPRTIPQPRTIRFVTELRTLCDSLNVMIGLLNARYLELQVSEERERRTNERMSLAVDSAGIGIWDLDIVDNVLLWDEQMYRIYDVAPEEFGGAYEAWERGLHPEDRSRSAEEYRLAVEGTKPFDTEFRIVTPSGQTRHVRAFARVVRDAAGAPVRMTGVNWDITKHKLDEAELEKYRNSLEDLVRKRTRELEEAQATIVRQERLAALGQLTATVSHELRNPFGTISGCLFVLRQRVGADDPRAAKIFERAERNLERCNRIIEELLDYTRVQNLELQPVPLDDWLKEVLDDVPLPEGTSLSTELATREIVEMDPEKIRRCVIKLVSNAFDAVQESPEGARNVTVRTKIENGCVVFAVADTGPGVPDELLQRIWEPLFTTKGFGIGLGLPHAKQLVELHHGTIEVTNEKNGGAQFAITLPTRAVAPSSSR